MIRRLLHVLLVFTLALNGISAPWAMERMNHDGHGDDAMSSGHHLSHAMDSTADSSVAHADHHSHTAMPDGATPAAQLPDAPHSDDCCDGMTCQCGCVLPLVVAFVQVEVPPALVEHARFAPIIANLVERRDSPPFRPPTAV